MKLKAKLLILGILSALLIYLTLPITNQNEKVYADNGKGSTIAGIDVSGMKEKEIREALNKAIEEWKSEPVIITDGGTKLEIDSSKIEFNVDQTITQFINSVDKPWYAFWEKKKVVHIPLIVGPNEDLKNEIGKFSVWKTDETYNAAISAISYLKGHEIEAIIADFSIYENERLSLAIEDMPNNVVNIKQIVEALNDYIVNPDETFSFNEVIQQKVGKPDADTLNFVASVLHSAVLETEFEIVERHQQSSIPSYVSAGKEAKVSLSTNEDFKFLNNSGHVALIKASAKDEKLKIEIYSDVKGKKVRVTVEEEVVKPRIVTRYSRDLAIGQSKLIQSGVEGLRVNVYRTITGDGETIDDRISRSYYPPKNRIVLVSARQETTSTENSETETTDPNDIDDSNTEDIDLDGDGLPDIEGDDSEETDDTEESTDDENLPPGSYYDKGGNLITP